MARARFREEARLHFWGDEIHRFDLFREVGRIGCPTLILSGALDPITTLQDHAHLAAAISGAQLMVVNGAGHGVYRDKPREALDAVRVFVSVAATQNRPVADV